jgi:hypothetical protein
MAEVALSYYIIHGVDFHACTHTKKMPRFNFRRFLHFRSIGAFEMRWARLGSAGREQERAPDVADKGGFGFRRPHPKGKKKVKRQLHSSSIKVRKS